MSTLLVTEARERLRVRVIGTVQGVGFRPFVHRLAAELELAGWVLNDARGVLLEVEGAPPRIERFVARLRAEAPPLAAIERLQRTSITARGETGFAIRDSPHGERPAAAVTPDAATCPACLGELFDPADRRYRYPFINCTDCGPRFTIVRGVPYDRPLTTMTGFAMCPECRAEYEDPADRRFHAQPNACPRCGPRARLLDGAGAAERGSDADADAVRSAADAVRSAADALRRGEIVAIKGLGGYHLACRADDEAAVARLRARKHREEKPFALMAPDLATTRRLVVLDATAVALLGSRARPIVLAPRRPGAAIAAAVAPGIRELGVMLPYTPLHHLLLADCATPLVLTSANLSDEPICFRDDEALSRLSPIADRFLIHDRPIETRTDDSVVRSAATGPMILRRSRGYVPGAIELPAAGHPDLLACGAQLKNTFCVARGGRAWISHHIGDLENLETLHSFTEGIGHFERLFDVRPQLVVHDLHPEYLSTKYAGERAGVSLLAVGHHHAHFAAGLAEHGECGGAVGAIYDGAGYGPDGTIWGGELLLGDIGHSSRAGSLRPVRMPGGAQAVRQPWRMACAWLQEATGSEPELPAPLRGRVPVRAWRAVAGLARSGLASPPTTSMGRLFDAVAALSGGRAGVSYEGQAAVELEAACDPAERRAYRIDVVAREDRLELDPREALLAIAEDVRDGVAHGQVAARFHAGVAAATVDACTRIAGAAGTETAVLSGGVFANRRLLRDVATGLRGAGLRVLVAQRLPVGDGGIAYGQAAVAAWASAR